MTHQPKAVLHEVLSYTTIQLIYMNTKINTNYISLKLRHMRIRWKQHDEIVKPSIQLKDKSKDVNNILLIMMTSSNGNIFRVTGPLCGEFTGPGEFPAQRPVTQSFDVFFHLRLNKRLSKQPWGWWFETPAWSLWRHRNEIWLMYSGDTDTTLNAFYIPGLVKYKNLYPCTLRVEFFRESGNNHYIMQKLINYKKN